MGVEVFATMDDGNCNDSHDNDHKVATIHWTGCLTSKATLSMAVVAMASTINVGNVGMMTMDGKNVVNPGLLTLLTKYQLLTREIATICGADFVSSIITLDSRLTVVHVATLHIAVDENDNDNNDIQMANYNPSAPTAI